MKSEKKKLNSLNDGGCGRKEDLVTYIYGEANATERASFERHLDDCDACSNELTAFGRVRLDMDAWQLGPLARPQFALRRSRLELMREFFGTFPAWVRGAAFAGAAAAVLLVSLSIAGTRISLKDGDFEVSFGRTASATPLALEAGSEEIRRIVQIAVAEERQKVDEIYSARLASFKDQLEAEHQAKLQVARAEHRTQLRAARAAVQQEMRRFNQQNTSIRAFFAREDSSDPWGDGR